MLDNQMFISANDKLVTGWTTVKVTQAIDKLAPQFSFSCVNRDDYADFIKPQEPTMIYLDGDKVLTGYTDKVALSHSTDGFTVSVTGRSRTGDLIDCSSVNSPGSWKNTSLVRICEDLCKPFSIKIIDNTRAVTKVPAFAIDTGESVFESLMRICGAFSIYPISNEDGDIVLMGGSPPEADDALVSGKNIVSITHGIDYTERFSKYVVKGQTSVSGGFSESTVSIHGEASDAGVSRHRPLQLRADDQMTNDLAKRMALWEAQVRMGKSREYSVIVPEWRQSNGVLWKPYMLVPIQVPRMQIDTKLLITQVSFSYDSSGRFTEISVADPIAFTAEPKPLVKETKKKGPFE